MGPAEPIYAKFLCAPIGGNGSKNSKGATRVAPLLKITLALGPVAP